MKTLKTILIILFVFIFIVVVGITFYLKTLDTTKIKDQISGEVGKAIDRSVEVGQLSFSFNLMQGVVLSIRNISIKDDAKFSQGDFLKIDSVGVALDLMPFVTKRQILVKHVTVSRPDVNLIRLSDGSLNIPVPKDNGKVSLNFFKSEEALSLSSLFITPAYAAQQSSNPFLKNLKVQIIKIKQGRIKFLDQVNSPALRATLNNVDVTLNDFQFNAPFTSQFKLSLYSTDQNVTGDALVELSEDGKEVSVQKGHVDVDLSPIDYKTLAREMPVLEPAGLQKTEGVFKLNVSSFKMVNNRIDTLNANGDLSKGSVSLETLAKPIDDINLKFDVSNNQFNLTQMNANVAGGSLTSKGMATNIFANPQGEFSLNVNSVQVSDLIQKFKLPFEIVGNLNSDATLSFKLPAPSPDIMTSLHGVNQLNIGGGRIKGINLLNLVIDRLSMFPNLKEKLMQTLPDNYKEKLSQSDTVIDEFKINTQLENAQIVIESLSLIAEGFAIEAAGKMDLSQNLDLNNLSFSIKEDLSESMAQAQPELQLLMDNNRRIRIPILPYHGKLSSVKVVPDLTQISRQAITNQGKGELRNLIYKALDIKEDGSNQSQQQNQPYSNQSEGNSPQESPQKDIIDGVLNNIFK
jgi:hypothetical protein